mgnify:CR=1 FL=1
MPNPNPVRIASSATEIVTPPAVSPIIPAVLTANEVPPVNGAAAMAAMLLPVQLFWPFSVFLL